MNFRIYGLYPDSIVDGIGLRIAIFFQGCLRHCKECHNPDSWPIDEGYLIDTDAIVKRFIQDPLLDGITLSGGEPFLQPDAALELAKKAHEKNLTVWCYTGYTFEEINEWEDNRKRLLAEIDVLVDGPFKKEEMSLEIPWRGSRNQRLIDVKKSLEKGEVVLYDAK